MQQGGAAVDLAGKPRVVGTAVDVGAYELQGLGPVDVTSRLSIARSGFQYNRTTHRYVQQVTLANPGTSAIHGPVSLVLDGLAAAVSLFGSNGVTVAVPPAGSPYRTAANSDLNAGASVTLLLEFTDSTNAPIAYAARVLAGPGGR